MPSPHQHRIKIRSQPAVYFSRPVPIYRLLAYCQLPTAHKLALIDYTP
ncbi:MAG TPA: hypothetical protein VKO18_21280 [Terriglobia bacterium]|nr:hypothetical protein [Terriglobia bacterium]